MADNVLAGSFSFGNGFILPQTTELRDWCFNGPHGLALDPIQRRLFVSNTSSHCIDCISLDPNSPLPHVVRFAGLPCPAGKLICNNTGHENGPLDTALFNYPQGLAFDPIDQCLYIADRVNNMIRRIKDGFVADICKCPFPNEITLNIATGDLYITSSANCVFKCSSTRTRFKTTPTKPESAEIVAGMLYQYLHQDGLAKQAGFHDPQGIVYSAIDNSLIISDYNNNCIRKISLSGELEAQVSTILGRPKDKAIVDGPISKARTDCPRGIVIDGIGNIYFCDSHLIRMIGVDGQVSTICSVNNPALPPNQPQWRLPKSIVIDDIKQRLIISDTTNIKYIEVPGISLPQH